jgi:hypothetical protein
MSIIGNYQSGFVPKRLREIAAGTKDGATTGTWGKKSMDSERAILRSLSRNHGRIGGQRRHTLAGRNDYGSHFRNPLAIEPISSANSLYGAPAGSSARDHTTIQPLCMETKPARPLDYVRQPVSELFHTGQ